MTSPDEPPAQPRKRGPRLFVILLLLILLAVPVAIVAVRASAVLASGGSMSQALESGLAQTKETLAESAGVKTSAAEAQERLDELNQAVRAVNQRQESFAAATQREDFPEVAALEKELASLLDAVRLAKARQTAYQAFVDQHKDAIQGVTKDARDEQVRHVALLDGLERRLAGVRIRAARVDAKVEWNNAGVDASAGDQVRVWARGQWKAGPKWKACGPEGTDETSSFGDYRMFQGQAKLMALVARISNQAAEGRGFVLGAHGAFEAPAGGTVQLRCNDTGVSNNEGIVDVVLLVLPVAPK